MYNRDKKNGVLTQGKLPQADAAVWCERHLGFVPDANQKMLLLTESQRVIVNCSRQWGKSFIAAAKAVHHATTQAKSVTLIVAPSERQSLIVVGKVRQLMGQSGNRLKGDGVNKHSVLFPNGSVIIGLPANEATIRGFTATLLLVDEAAKVNDRWYEAVFPALATTNGTVWLMSTPYGKRGFFYRAWAKGGDDWVRMEVPATECARITASFLEKERRDKGERMFFQEYLCTFNEVEDGTFDAELIDAAWNDGVEPLDL